MKIKSVEEQANGQFERVTSVHSQIHQMFSGLNLLINNIAYMANSNLPDDIREQLVNFGHQVTVLETLIDKETDE